MVAIYYMRGELVVKIYKVGHIISHWDDENSHTIGHYKSLDSAKKALEEYMSTQLHHEETTISQICYTRVEEDISTSQIYIEEIVVLK